jgi:hypothetical protein
MRVADSTCFCRQRARCRPAETAPRRRLSPRRPVCLHRCRAEIMGPGKYEIVGESQPVLMIIHPIISTRARMGSAGRPARRLCRTDVAPVHGSDARARVAPPQERLPVRPAAPRGLDLAAAAAPTCPQYFLTRTESVAEIPLRFYSLHLRFGSRYNIV